MTSWFLIIAMLTYNGGVAIERVKMPSLEACITAAKNVVTPQYGRISTSCIEGSTYQ